MGRLDKLTIFGHFWAVATFSSGLRWLSESNAWGWPMIVAASALLARPRSLVALVAVMLTKIGFVVDIHPFCPNHVLFESLVDLTVIAVIVGVSVPGRRRVADAASKETRREEIIDTFSAPTRISLLVLYFFTVFHKLNRDFFDITVSCGPALLALLKTRVPVPAPEWVQMMAVWGTLALEIAIPIGLCFARTRRGAIVAGVAFHFVLAQLPATGLYSFGTMMFGLYLLFLSPAFADGVDRRWSALTGRIPIVWRSFLRWGIPLSLVGIVAGIVLVGAEARLKLVGLLLWNAWLVGLVVVTERAFRGEGAVSRGPGLFRPRPAVLWVLPVVIFLNGLNPYLGLKTLTSFAMLSNLRTEGGQTNHFFMRRWVWLTSYQDDLVEILDTDQPHLQHYREQDLLITFHELRRICGGTARDFQLTYDRAGETNSVAVRDGVSSDPELTAPLRGWRAWYFGFRPVDAGPKMGCRR